MRKRINKLIIRILQFIVNYIENLKCWRKHKGSNIESIEFETYWGSIKKMNKLSGNYFEFNKDNICLMDRFGVKIREVKLNKVRKINFNEGENYESKKK